MAYECDKNYCSRQYYMNLSNTLIVPTEIGNAELTELLGYFQYRAPGISSEHSFSIPESDHKKIFSEMFDGRKFEAMDFYNSNKTILRHLDKNHLSKNSICCTCKRFVCRLNDGTETKLNCFLRHIRNSLAHGRVHLVKKSRYIICFEDINKRGNITARIICNKEDLKVWRKILNRYK